MAFPIFPIVIAGATAAIGYLFQENAAKNVRLRKKAESELERAKEIFNEISDFILAWHAIIESASLITMGDDSGSPAEQKKKLAEQKTKLAELQTEFNQSYAQWRRKSRLLMHQSKRYFGEDTADRLLVISNRLERLGRELASSMDLGDDMSSMMAGLKNMQEFVDLDAEIDKFIDLMLEKM